MGACVQERITRVRAAGFNASGLPDEALDEMLRRTKHRREDISTYVLTDSFTLPSDLATVRLDHHHAHACSAFLPSGFESAVILVCDHEAPYVSLWDGDGANVNRIDWTWRGIGLANLYSECADALGFSGAEHRMEALARLDTSRTSDWATPLFALDEDGLKTASDWREQAVARCGRKSHSERAVVAAGLQSRIGDLLVSALSIVRRCWPLRRRICLGGSLFYNSNINSRAKLSGLFDDVFVPMNPGNAGLSIGAAMHTDRVARQPVTPFLGPSYSYDDIKATLDNCKLTYRWVSEADAIATSVDALRKGQLVAWFEGAMECGPRALGARSILASPFSPYVLDNLNSFLKHRDPWRGYALTGLAPAVRELFDGPYASPFMECDYVPKDRTRFRHVLPAPTAEVRVQTVENDGPPQFRTLLRTFGDATGYPVLVNTSFNGFQEPIVCSPRDAVRVFFGTGIDMLVFGQFILTK
jgi:carbamoyltransferase